MDKPKKGNEKRTARKFGRAVNKAEKKIKSGAINPEEDYVNPMQDMDPATRRAYLNTLSGEKYVEAMRSQMPQGNPFQKKGGISTKGKAFFNPSLSKPKAENGVETNTTPRQDRVAERNKIKKENVIAREERKKIKAEGKADREIILETTRDKKTNRAKQIIGAARSSERNVNVTGDRRIIGNNQNVNNSSTTTNTTTNTTESQKPRAGTISREKEANQRPNSQRPNSRRNYPSDKTTPNRKKGGTIKRKK